jgi:serine/threonine protein kinase
MIMIKKRALSECDRKEQIVAKRLRPNDHKLGETVAKSSVFNTPLTPTRGQSPHKKDDNENIPFKTPIKSVVMTTPVKASPTTVVPETPLKSVRSVRHREKIRRVKLYPEQAQEQQPVLGETPKKAPTLRDRNPSSELSGICNCPGKEQVCRVCTKKSESFAPRAGTPGFRAPEVLLKHMQQTTAIDIWSAGVIFASLLSGRYPFFRNTDDMTSLAEITTLMGTKRVMRAASDLGKRITMTAKTKAPIDLKSLLLRLRGDPEFDAPDTAYHLLDSLLEPNPRIRITADEALQHPFIIQ